MNKITVTIFHNDARDQDGRPTAMLDGFTPGDPMVRVFSYQIPAERRPPETVAEDAFAAFNGHPRDARAAEASRRYYQRRLRSLSAGDVVAVGEAALAVGRPAGWEPVRGGLAEVRVHEHGTHSLPAAPCKPPERFLPEGTGHDRP